MWKSRGHREVECRGEKSNTGNQDRLVVAERQVGEGRKGPRGQEWDREGPRGCLEQAEPAAGG